MGDNTKVSLVLASGAFASALVEGGVWVASAFGGVEVPQKIAGGAIAALTLVIAYFLPADFLKKVFGKDGGA